MGIRGAIRRAYERQRVASITKHEQRKEDEKEYRHAYRQSYRKEMAKAAARKAARDAKSKAFGGSRIDRAGRRAGAMADWAFGAPTKSNGLAWSPGGGFAVKRKRKKRRSKRKTFYIQIK